ncbi:hypothetical protein E5288_WYG015049 [Bos mutus]|uniref:Uncharacterized protein n=1 Tax=Bos mutus TaxID=72004 RepID=A0A6B0S413_9CETA|nr:hypothetical protein [Bos mutus]
MNVENRNRSFSTAKPFFHPRPTRGSKRLGSQSLQREVCGKALAVWSHELASSHGKEPRAGALLCVPAHQSCRLPSGPGPGRTKPRPCRGLVSGFHNTVNRSVFISPSVNISPSNTPDTSKCKVQLQLDLARKYASITAATLEGE